MMIVKDDVIEIKAYPSGVRLKMKKTETDIDIDIQLLEKIVLAFEKENPTYQWRWGASKGTSKVTSKVTKNEAVKFLDGEISYASEFKKSQCIPEAWESIQRKIKILNAIRKKIQEGEEEL